jgi:DNA (cytosine-5)-methyltransferase 1
VRPRLLDLFCGAGGAGMGYHRAGFEVVGVDARPQPRYPFSFVQVDALRALEYVRAGFAGYDGFAAIHASPPCQFATAYGRSGRVGRHENLIPATRELLESTGLPYVIENVEGARAELRRWAMLCGSMFDPPLDVRRHRYFETNWGFVHDRRCRHGLWPADRFPGGRSKQRTGSSRGLARATVEVGTWDIPLETQQAAMGIDWMSVPELSQAIPPAYTELIGRQLVTQLAGALVEA